MYQVTARVGKRKTEVVGLFSSEQTAKDVAVLQTEGKVDSVTVFDGTADQWVASLAARQADEARQAVLARLSDAERQLLGV